MTRSVGRLHEVVQSLNVNAVGVYSMTYLRAAMTKIVGNKWIEPSIMRGLKIAQKNDPSPHVRDLATDAITIIKEKGLKYHG